MYILTFTRLMVLTTLKCEAKLPAYCAPGSGKFWMDTRSSANDNAQFSEDVRRGRSIVNKIYTVGRALLWRVLGHSTESSNYYAEYRE